MVNIVESFVNLLRIAPDRITTVEMRLILIVSYQVENFRNVCRKLCS